MALTLVTSTFPNYYYDAGAPLTSYVSQSITINSGDFYFNTSTGDFYTCDDGSNQNSLVWSLVATQYRMSVGQSQPDWNESSPLKSSYIKNKPSLYTPATPAYSSPNFSSVTSASQLSSTRDAYVSYVFPTSLTSILASQSLTALLQYADDSGMSTNLVTVNADVQGCSGILNLTLSGRLQVGGRIPAGKYRKVTLSQSGGATVPTTISSAQEVLL